MRRAPPPTDGARVRRSLTHVGGVTRTRGDTTAAPILAAALDVASSISAEAAEQAARAHVHGFHTYPARMHPTIARRTIEALSQPGQTVLDPFCGSGTVLVEAMLAGRRAAGADLNPLAVALARRKVTPAPEAERRAILEAASRCAEVAAERRAKRVGASRRYAPVDVEAFEPHVMLELDGLRVGIEALPRGPVRDTLHLVLSAMLVKVSRATSDTSSAPSAPVRRAAGFTTRFFVDKTRELVERLAEIATPLAAAPPANLAEEDARRLKHIPDRSVDLVVTSPPYAGVYDYVEHHRARLRWLGLSERRFEQDEIGARRDLRDLRPEHAWQVFEDQLVEVFRALHRVLRQGGRVMFLLADATLGDRVLYADDLAFRLAQRTRFDPTAVASQPRPDFRGGARPRETDLDGKHEHAILLTKAKDDRS